MSLALIAIVLLVAVAATTIFWPLRGGHETGLGEERDRPLEVARDSKLAEIDELERDFGLGKLSGDDYRAINAELRAEAVEILRAIDASAANARRARGSGGQR
jgi:hypothetical protein